MAAIPTPEQGKPILDFSAGTFDGNSNLFQSRNGATEHVNGDDVADYVNTSRLYNTLDTESKTTVGAINEVNREVDRGGVQLTQAQYDALVNAGTVDANTTYFITDGQNITTASAVTYDNTDSGMTATDVQSAIDEVNGKDASDIAYDNTASGLTATDVNAAIDEVVDDRYYHVGDTVDISALVLSCYSTTTRLDIYVPLPKKIPAGATLTIAGNWRIILTNNSTLASSVVLNNAALSTIGTVSAVILEGGISIRVALNSGVVPAWSLGNAFAMGSNFITIS